MIRPTDWFWEGNVQAAIASFLEINGWTLGSVADTISKAQGVDIEASKDAMSLMVEVKGYPSRRYADPRRAHETKRTNPLTQAAQWYGQAVLKAMRMLSSFPDARVAIGFPDFPRYRNLLAETEGSLRTLGIGVILVTETGQVRVTLPPEPRTETEPDSFEGLP